MSIKPVLVPDHDAASLRKLMDRFAEATTGPTRKQLTESRAAVTAARKTITEGSISDLLNQDPTSPKFNDHPGASRLKKAEGDPKPVTTGHFADKKGQPKPYPALKNTSTGKVRAHPNDPEQGVAEGADGAAGVKYGVFAKGGSVGSQRFRDDPLKTFDTKEEAVADARRRRSGLSKGERGYYRMGYVVKPIKGEVDEGMIDNIKNTVRAANYDRLARRSNSQAVAGGGLAPPAQFRALSDKGDQRAQKAQDIRKGDVAEGYDAGGAYDKWDPKHPDFVKNFRKFQASNPGATLKDFIADLKKGVTEGLDASEDAVRVRGGQRFLFPEDGKFGYTTDGGDNQFTILDQETGEVRDIPLDKLPDNPLQADLENLVNEYDDEQFTSGASVPDWIKKSSGMWKEGEGDVEEGWKQKVAGAALAGAAALGAGGAQAQTTDKYDPDWNAHSMTHHIRSDVSSTKGMNSADPSQNIDDFQKRIQKVTGPNAKGEYKVVVLQNGDIVSHYVTKTPPPGWLYKEGVLESVDPIDPIEQLRADIKRFSL